jgi:hypothetical protein
MSEALRRIEDAYRDGSDELSLCGLELTAVPDEIGRLTKLTVLSLDTNRLTSLPAAIGNLVELDELSVTENCLTSLPREIGRLTKLRALCLQCNQLVALPPEIGGLSSLTFLDIEDNQLTALPAEIGDMANLSTLKLARNRLTALPPEMARLTKIKPPQFPVNQRHIVDPRIRLTLYGNPLVDPPAEIHGIGEVMAYLRDRLKAKQRVWLEGNKLEIVEGTTVAQYWRIVQALVDDGGRVLEASVGTTVMETRNARLTAHFDEAGTTWFECNKVEVLEYVRAFLLRNSEALLA